ncbi:MAG TPA: hypothetical protein V6C96_02805, partial [Vampirovibrionales bacterium]
MASYESDLVSIQMLILNYKQERAVATVPSFFGASRWFDKKLGWEQCLNKADTHSSEADNFHSKLQELVKTLNKNPEDPRGIALFNDTKGIIHFHISSARSYLQCYKNWEPVSEENLPVNPGMPKYAEFSEKLRSRTVTSEQDSLPKKSSKEVRSVNKGKQDGEKAPDVEANTNKEIRKQGKTYAHKTGASWGLTKEEYLNLDYSGDPSASKFQMSFNNAIWGEMGCLKPEVVMEAMGEAKHCIGGELRTINDISQLEKLSRELLLDQFAGFLIKKMW